MNRCPLEQTLRFTGTFWRHISKLLGPIFTLKPSVSTV
ncbi:hypothetical protein CCACVL1_22479 [Corchorus capsularis]|uniref:Uncharacterized protein n=1 Tax=Corchorus capsularis TaxID=210143 RepID=A0A1R3GYE3_COCAP|nr:hypothetical protein CCACVL1_22479 [Corchorus capsularis]